MEQGIVNNLSPNEIKEKIEPILREAGIVRAAVFGSVARGEERQNDVDILVEMPRPYGLFSFLSLRAKLEDVLGIKVDLIEYSNIKPIIKDRIIRDSVQIL